MPEKEDVIYSRLCLKMTLKNFLVFICFFDFTKEKKLIFNSACTDKPKDTSDSVTSGSFFTTYLCERILRSQLPMAS